MKYLELTLPTPEENLACDEALLEHADAGAGEEVLRFWESATPFVVVGYANRVALEVKTEACQKHAVPILRRCTGGGTVVQGPGCLNYSLVLDISKTKALASIPSTNRYVMETHRQAFTKLLGTDVRVSGHTDLAVDGRKFSGNAQRRKRRCLLYHGTFLLTFDLALIEETLALPSQQPAYRASRSHLDFVRNIPIEAAMIKTALAQCWSAHEPGAHFPAEMVASLVREKYARADWNQRY